MTEETLMDSIGIHYSNNNNIDLFSYTHISQIIKEWGEGQVRELEKISKNPLHRTPIDIICNRKIIKWLKRKIPVEIE